MVAQRVEAQAALIDHPEHVPLIILRPHYLDIVGKGRRTLDVVAGAALLGVFEFWTTQRKRKVAQDPKPRPGWEWIVKSLQQLSDVLLNMFGTKTLRAALKLLVERGLISVRDNAMLKVDRKKQYRFEVSAVRTQIAAWASSQQATDGTTAHLANMPHGKAEMPNDTADLPNEAAKVPDEPAQSAESVFIESSLETPVDNPDPDPFVADATGVTSNEELAVPYDPNRSESDPTPSPDEPAPSSPVPPPPASQAAGAPEGYEYRYAPTGSGKTVHLVALGSPATVCGKSIGTLLDAPKEGRSYSMCQQCMAKRDPKPRVDQPIRDAVAEHVQGFPPSMATDFTGVLASIAIAVWTRLLERKLNSEDYPKVARSVEAFVRDWKRQNPDKNIPTGKDAFENNFTKFVSKAKSDALKESASASAPTTPAAEPPPESQILSGPGLFTQYANKERGET